MRHPPSENDAMSTSIIIGEVPDAVREELAARADLSGRSLEEYVRDELIALARRPSAAVWMARVRARKDALQQQHGEGQRGDGVCEADAGMALGSGAPDRFTDDHPVTSGHPVTSQHGERGSEPRASESPLAEPRRDVG
jgi:hypothetical protein